MINYLFLLIFFINLPEPSTALMNNSVGVAYLKTADELSYELEIAFPIYRLTNQKKNIVYDYKSSTLYTFNFEGTLQFFDENGVIGTIRLDQQFKMEFWCENDGGTQFRPTARIKILKSQLERSFPTANQDIQNIVSFVGANIDEHFESLIPDTEWEKKIVLKGDLNNDGIIDARIWTIPDDAQNCDGNPKNNLMIYLDSNGKNNRMRCCGP